MEFDAIVGNPPYQIMDGGAQASSTPVYNLFVDMAKKVKPCNISMIMPARWFAGGKGLDTFRENTLHEKHISKLVDYFDSTLCFPGVDISGGVCYFLWSKNISEKCTIVNVRNDMVSTSMRPLLEEDTDAYIRFNESVSIIKKTQTNLDISFADLVSSRKPFGLVTNVKISEAPTDNEDVAIFAYPKNGYISRNKVQQNIDWINEIKVCISYAYGERGDFPYFVIGKPFIAPPNSCCTETYLVIKSGNNSSIAQNICSYMKSKFLRFLVLQKKNTQHATKQVYELVPMQDFTEKSDIDWSKSVSEIDAQLYKKYGLSKEEIAFIESMIKPME